MSGLEAQDMACLEAQDMFCLETQEMGHPVDTHLWVTQLTQNQRFFYIIFTCLESVWEYGGHVLASFWHPPGNALGSNF